MEKKLNIGNVVLTVVAVLLIGLFGFIIYNDNRLQSHSAVEVRTDPAYEQLITENMEKIQKVINNNLNSIVFYGDEYLGNNAIASGLQNIFDKELFSDINSLTEKYPRVIGYKLSIPVINFEVHDESIDTIMARLGIVTTVVGKSCVIPADTETGIEIELNKAGANTTMKFSGQTYIHLGTVTINDIEGSISSSEDNEDVYIFKRTSPGKETKIKSGTKVYFESFQQYKNALPIIFFGNNDFANTQQYMNYIRAIIQRQDNKEKYIIICRTKANSELDTAMTELYGNNYIRTDDEIDYKDMSEKIYSRMKLLKYTNRVANSVEGAKRRLFEESSEASE